MKIFISSKSFLLFKLMVKQFKEASTLPNGENIYEWWLGRSFEIDTKFDDLEKDNSYNIIPTWKLKEEEILGSF